MCGRFTLASDLGQFLSLFDVDAPPELEHPRQYNIAPSQPVVGLVADPHTRLEVMEWGFLPTWSRPGSDARTVINARVESLEEGKPYFRGAFRSARCIIMADGFYEWKKERGGKRPFHIGLKKKGVFGFAGLWSMPHESDGTHRATCAIITLPANDFMRDIHDRMPAILRPSDLERWIDPKTPSRELFKVLEPYPSEEMTAHEVGVLVNNPRNDVPECIRPIDEGEDAPAGDRA